MGEFTDRVRDFATVSNLRESVALLSELSRIDWDNEEMPDVITRLSAICENALGRLTIADRNLVRILTLDALDIHTQQMLDTVRSLKGSAPGLDVAISSVNDQADEILAAASELPNLPIRTTPKVLEKAAEQFDREASSARASISAEATSLRTEMADIYERIQQSTTNHDHLLSQLGDSINEHAAEAQNASHALLTRTSEASERMERDQTSIQEVFREFQRGRDEEFLKAQNVREQEFREQLDPVIADVESFRDQARGMLEEVAGASSAEHYARQRDSQKEAADRWRRIGVAAFVALVIAGVGIFYDAVSSSRDFSVAWLVARSGLVIPILLVATYALSQSGQHRRREEEISRVSNELMLLWPFVNRLPDEDRKSLMLNITPLYFKGGLSAQSPAEQVNFAERARDAVKARPRRSSDS